MKIEGTGDEVLEGDFIVRELEPDSHVITTEKAVINESHMVVEGDETFPEGEGQFVGESEGAVDSEEKFDDSLDDVIHVPAGDVFTTMTESTEAWPAEISESAESAQLSGEETGGERKEDYQKEFLNDPHAYQPFPIVFLESSSEKGFEFAAADNNNLIADVATGDVNEEFHNKASDQTAEEFQEFKPNFQEPEKPDENGVTTVDDLLG